MGKRRQTKDNRAEFEQLLQRKIAAGLTAAASTHAALYRDKVAEHRGQRPIPFRHGPPGNPYRSQKGQYPFVQPETPAGYHGYEYISFTISKGGMIAKSGLEKGGMHLWKLSHDVEFVSKFGARLGLDHAYKDNLDVIATAFAAAARMTK